MKQVVKSLAGIAALALGHTAMAQTNVYITGSTAYRNAVESLLANTSTNIVFDSPSGPTKIASAGTTVGASYANFEGTIGGVSVRIKCGFTGSAGGIYLVANNSNPAAKTYFLPDAATGTAVATPDGTHTGDDLHNSDIAFSDAYQLSSFFPTPTIANDTRVGIVPFKWVGNYSLANPVAGVTPITNITSQQVTSLFSGAFLESVAQLAGTTVAADKSTYVFAIGRDFDSGTRITAFADSGNGSTQSPSQWQPFMSATSAGNDGTNNWVGTPAGSPAQGDQFVAKIRQWNAAGATFLPSTAYNLYNNTLTVSVRNGGFNSGGDLAKVMRSDSNTLLPAFYNTSLKGRGAGKIGYNSQNCTGAYFITYLGLGDAGTALAAVSGSTFGKGPGRELAFNGVAYSTQAIQTGQYSFWGFEHVLSNVVIGDGSAADVTQNALINAVTNNTDATQGGAGLLLSSMSVDRASDGAPILAGYY